MKCCYILAREYVRSLQFQKGYHNEEIVRKKIEVQSAVNHVL
jgi:hypothetical protein